MGQPWQNTTSRVPGPSTVPKVSTEWTRPRTASGPIARPLSSMRAKPYIASWKVREMTSSCCSRVSLLKFTA